MNDHERLQNAIRSFDAFVARILGPADTNNPDEDRTDSAPPTDEHVGPEDPDE